MSSEETRRAINAYLGALLDRGDFASHIAPDAVWTTMETGEALHGREAIRDYISALHERIFDAHAQVDSLMVDDATACLEAVFVGRHIGEIAGMRPDGAQVRVPYCIVYTVAGGLISEFRAYLPIAALLNQLREASNTPTPT